MRHVTRIELFDNVYLTAIRSEKFKTGCFSVNFLRMLDRSEAAQNALLAGLLLSGCESCPDIRSISIKLDTLYGASVGTLTRKKGAVQAVGLYADFIEDDLAGEPVFRPLAQFVGELLLRSCTENGGFRQDYFATERNNLVNALRAALNNKQSFANLCLLKKMYENERYGIPAQGSEEDLSGVDEKSLYAQYKRVLGSSRVELFYHGRASAEDAAEVFRKMLEGLPRQAQTRLWLPENQPVSGQRYFEQEMPLAQSKLAMGFRASPAADAEPLAGMLVFAVLYGGGSNCKLFANVREQKSLCYYANAVYDKYQGALRVNSGIAAENYDAAKDEILRQLSDCAEGRFTESELDAAKRLLLSQLQADLDTPGRLDEFWLGQAVLGRSYGMEALKDAVERVTAAQVRRAAESTILDTVFFLKGVGE